MVKPTKYLRKQAAKAERAASRLEDPEVSAEMRALAEAYRNQAEVIKRNKRAAKNERAKVSRGD